MTISKEYPSGKLQAVIINAWHDGKPARLRITGHRNCQTILALHENLKQGITAQEMSSWAYRLASYVFKLKTKYNLDIDAKPEPHDGGEHARYFLNTPIDVIEIQ